MNGLPARSWTTNFKRLLAKGVTDDDIIITRLLTVTDNGHCYERDTKICSAHLIRSGENAMTWHIHDTADDSLLIPVSADSMHLGRTVVEGDDATTIHIITGCHLIKANIDKNDLGFVVRTKKLNELVAYAENYHVAVIISEAIKELGVKTTIISREEDSVHEPLLS